MALRALNITPVMLTGDNRRVAAQIAAQAGIDEVHAELLPEDKERILAAYKEKGVCAMVGDGINDAPALAGADVGLAIGAGTGVAVESAGVVLSGNSLTDAVAAIELGRATRRNIRQNLFWALCYNSICIPLAAGALYPVFGILLTPMLASAAMSVSSVFVVCNALRLTRYTPPARAARICEVQSNKAYKKEDDDMFGLGKKKKFEISIEGMSCKHCSERVEKLLNAVPGVKAVVDLDSAKAVIEASAKVSVEKIKKVIEEAGFKAVDK